MTRAPSLRRRADVRSGGPAYRGFVRPVQIYRVGDFLSEEHRERRRQLLRIGERVEVNVIDSSDIRAAIEELRQIQEDFAKEFGGN